MDEQRKLLDALMGADRDGDSSRVKHFSDDDICKSYLCGLCPLQLFTNTKMDLGHCNLTHSDALKEEYEKEKAACKPRDFRYDYEYQLLNQLQRIVDDCDRRIQRADRRIEQTKDPEPDLEKIKTINAAIQKLQEEAERLGEEGMVDESMEKMQQADALRQELLAEQQQAKEKVVVGPDVPANVAQTLMIAQQTNHQQKLRVCHVCSALLSTQESDLRLADHFGGKMHMGFMTVRKKLEELREYFREHPELVRGGRGGYDGDVERSRNRDRERHQRGRDRDFRGRDYDRERKRPGDRRRDDDGRRDDYRRRDDDRRRDGYRRRDDDRRRDDYRRRDDDRYGRR